MKTLKRHIQLTAGLCLLLVLFFNCKKNKENSDLPKISTSPVTYIGDKSAIGSGTVLSIGSSKIYLVGICWSTSHGPTISNNTIGKGKDTIGDFTCYLTGLTAHSTYYVRAYAYSYSGVAYGNEVSFTTTAPLPALTTQNVTDITSTSAISGGDILDSAGLDITARGICWNTNPNPTIDDYKTNNGKGKGSFLSSITGLIRNNTYYVRSYAVTSAGTGYGNTVIFVIDIDGNIYTTVTIGSQIWMLQNLKVTHYRNGEIIPNASD